MAEEEVIEEEGEPKRKVGYFIAEIEQYEKQFKKWKDRANRILKRFRDERDFEDSLRKSRVSYNIFWSNVSVLQPSLYSRTPKTQIERRYRDKDPMGRTAAMVLERATDFSNKSYDFDAMMKKVRDDFLIVGRGTAWVRYIPHFEVDVSRIPITVQQIPDQLGQPVTVFLDPQGELVEESKVLVDENTNALFANPEDVQEQVVYEEVRCDYLHWDDFYHSCARSWEEITWVAKRVWMTKEELKKRFGSEIANQIPLQREVDDSRSTDSSDFQYHKKAEIFELWDKETRKVYWLSRNHSDDFLDQEDDPLGLTDFFPCPRPLYATITTDSLVPIPDFSMYQDQAGELDKISSMISELIPMIRVSGVYDGTNTEIAQLAESGGKNPLIPVKDWPSFAQRGGFDGVIQFLPFAEAASALNVLYGARDKVIQDIYQITSISDIIRGSTSPSETATAQQLKGQYATLRLADRQGDLQRFARDVMAIKAEVIAEHFSTTTIRLMTGTEFIDDANVPQTFAQAVQLLRNDTLRQFRIDVETDSTLAIDEALEKEKRTEFLGTIGRFMSNTLQVIQQIPQMAPFAIESLMFLVRGFKTGRALEASLENSLNGIVESLQQQQQAAIQQQQAPSPEQIKAQLDGQVAQARLQIEQFKAEAKNKLEMQKAFADAEINQLRASIEAKEAQFKQILEVQKAQSEIVLNRERFELETQLKAAEIESKFALKQQEIVDKQNIETIKALTSQKAEKSEAFPPINIQVDATRPGRKIATFQTAADGTRVAEIVDVEA